MSMEKPRYIISLADTIRLGIWVQCSWNVRRFGMKQCTGINGPARAAGRPSIRLPAGEASQVHAIVAAARTRTGARRKPLLLMGRNASAAAVAIAGELRIELFRIDLAAVASKYIG